MRDCTPEHQHSICWMCRLMGMNCIAVSFLYVLGRNVSPWYWFEYAWNSGRISCIFCTWCRNASKCFVSTFWWSTFGSLCGNDRAGSSLPSSRWLLRNVAGLSGSGTGLADGGTGLSWAGLAGGRKLSNGEGGAGPISARGSSGAAAARTSVLVREWRGEAVCQKEPCNSGTLKLEVEAGE